MFSLWSLLLPNCRKYYDQITISFGSEPSSGKYKDLQFIGKNKNKKTLHYAQRKSKNYFKQKNHFKAWNYMTRISAFKINIKIYTHLLSSKQRSAIQCFIVLPLHFNIYEHNCQDKKNWVWWHIPTIFTLRNWGKTLQV